MIRALRRSLKIFWVAALLLACASTHAAASDPELGPSRRSAASPQSYEAAAGSGGLHRAGDVWVHVDNTNLSPGNFWYFQGLNQDPAAEWPGPSGTEYLVYSSLWIAGHDQLHGRRVDQGDEIRGDIAAFARTRHAYEGIAQGARGVDDDGDKSVDEEFLNGVDDDGDGKVDEDYAAISPDMFTSEMNDFTPQAIADATNIDQHHPLGLRVRRTSFAWTALGKRDFVGLHYEITNVTRQLEGGAGHGIDSLYLGMFWRPVAGARSTLSSSDDDFVGSARLASDGLNPPFAPQLARHVSKDEQNLNIFWTADNDGDGGQVGGAGAILLLGATRFPRLGLKPEFTAEDMSSDDIGNAPRSILPRSFHIYDPNLPY